ncbi:MAG: hypothetical protein HQL26_01905 [Candidatus Omnitrophica bacterium]|nr:hypothetical protein [Candidatus Omnitrophota bacterium]
MKKILFIFLMVIGASYAWAETQSFNISLTIPAIIGVNVPMPTYSPTADTLKQNTENNNASQQISTESIFKDGQQTIIKTVMVK